MSLLNIFRNTNGIILEADFKKILSDKIELPEPLVDEVVSTFHKKNVIFFGNIMKALTDGLSTDAMKMQVWQNSKDILVRLGSYMRNPNLPNLSNDHKKWILTQPVNVLFKIIHLNRKFAVIFDYVSNTNVNVRDSDFNEVYADASEWHDSLTAGNVAIKTEEGQVVIFVFEDGYYWLDLKKNKCEKEGKSMGHCGMTQTMDTLLSLRDPNGNPHVTVAYSYKNGYSQMKGKQNMHPKEEYWDYCMWLFDHKEVVGGTPVEREQLDNIDNHNYILTFKEEEYEGRSDFILSDYSEIDEERVEGLLEEHPELLSIQTKLVEAVRRGKEFREVYKIYLDDQMGFEIDIDNHIYPIKNRLDYEFVYIDMISSGSEISSVVSDLLDFRMHDAHQMRKIIEWLDDDRELMELRNSEMFNYIIDYVREGRCPEFIDYLIDKAKTNYATIKTPHSLEEYDDETIWDNVYGYLIKTFEKDNGWSDFADILFDGINEAMNDYTKEKIDEYLSDNLTDGISYKNGYTYFVGYNNGDSIEFVNQNTFDVNRLLNGSYMLFVGVEQIKEMIYNLDSGINISDELDTVRGLDEDDFNAILDGGDYYDVIDNIDGWISKLDENYNTYFKELIN